jgi:peptidoglycan-N-acetylglucosamine deacetylase
MPATLDALAAKGYKFVTVSQLIAMNRPKSSPTPGGSPDQPPRKKAKKVAAQ